MDLIIFEWINGFSGRFVILDEIMIMLSSWLIYILIGILVIVAIFSKKRIFGIVGLSGILMGMGINYLITLFYFRPRPFVSHDVTVLIDKAPSASFPSDTVLIAFAAATALWMLSRKAGWLFLVVAAFVAISRIFVGHHYPGDVIAGSIIGIASVHVCGQVYERFFTKKVAGDQVVEGSDD